MKLDFMDNLPEEILAKLQRHSAGTDNLKSRSIGCHFCGHMTIIVYENSQGHIDAKCRKCHRSAIYNVSLRRSNPFFVSFLGY